jgi:2-oxoglutarate dehydrogenase E1 component
LPTVNITVVTLDTGRGPGGAEADPVHSDALGINEWLVEEMYQAYRSNPLSVGDTWRDFFAEYRGRLPPDVPVGPDRGSLPRAGQAAIDTTLSEAASPAVAVPPPVRPVPERRPASEEPTVEGQVTLLRGARGRIAENMVASLTVPTATSVRPIPARALEANRSLLNDRLAEVGGPKVSFTHLIGWAVVRALGEVPALNASYVEDADGKGTPGVERHRHVGLALAIDLERPDGSRSLVVPVIEEADTLDFAGFLAAYDDLVGRARAGKLVVEDLSGGTVTITNPGTLGTTQSMPRLMRGQGAIVGIGALDYPVEFQTNAPETLHALGVGKVVTLTSTYDHRIIQGAESGLFLRRVHELLVGEHGFFDEVFSSCKVADEPVRWPKERPSAAGDGSLLVKELMVRSLINMYRVRGHLIARLNPLEDEPRRLRSDLDPEQYGLEPDDLDRAFHTFGLPGGEVLPLAEILEILRDAYCGSVGVEYMHIQSPEEKLWVQHHVEGVSKTMTPAEKRHILARLNAAEAFETFLHLRYVGQKRFGLEGAESTIPFLDAVLDSAAKAGISEVVLGMAHRGRLNVLANIVGKSYREIFDEFEGNLDPETVQGSGDVKYHKGAVGRWHGRDGTSLPVMLASNPSHLEAVDPVVEGIVRAKQDREPNPRAFSVLPLLVHGDAAFAGQGVVAETLNLSMLKGYRTGGTVHLVVNNQLGFTTPPTEARSSMYPTDVAKMVQSPILHVNGDDPEACVRVARLAFEYRQTFHKDVVVDLVCYRRHGHNEGDDPSYTQPLMYKKIDGHRSVRTLYTEALVKRGDITDTEAEQVLEDFHRRLQAALDETRSVAPPSVTRLVAKAPKVGRLALATAVDADLLGSIVRRLGVLPAGFTVHPKLARQLDQRAALFAAGEVDWSLAEALAFASLLLEGIEVRLTGQDTRRGTFSQRHAVLVDYVTGSEFTPLASLGEPVGGSPPLADAGVGSFFIRDSLLSEYAVLGFEYGYSVEAADALVAWEAQFGDFANGAQIVIDNFIVAAEEKWGQVSGIVLLLPHGHEGQGPEHSSARLERFLALAAGSNITVAQPTTAAQYFHLLRAQVERRVRRPLVVATPKALLRARFSRSPIAAFTSGGFAEVLDDPARADSLEPHIVGRVICCSGEIAREALARREALVAAGTSDPLSAIVRVEQLYPWPEAQLVDVLDRYPAAGELVWLQAEPENMGAWNFVHGKIHRLFRDRYRLRHVSRPPSGSPATGSHAVHELELGSLLDEAVGRLPGAS